MFNSWMLLWKNIILARVHMTIVWLWIKKPTQGPPACWTHTWIRALKRRIGQGKPGTIFRLTCRSLWNSSCRVQSLPGPPPKPWSRPSWSRRAPPCRDRSPLLPGKAQPPPRRTGARRRRLRWVPLWWTTVCKGGTQSSQGLLGSLANDTQELRLQFGDMKSKPNLSVFYIDYSYIKWRALNRDHWNLWISVHQRSCFHRYPAS